MSPPHRAPGRPACRGRGGFTLIELLVVALLLGIVIVAIAATLGAGLRVWGAAQTFGRAESGGLLALETVCRDLRNTFAFSGVPFQGDADTLAFAGLVRDADAGTARVGTIRYLHDRARQALIRESRPCGDAGARVRRETLAEHVAGLRFTWAPPDGGAGTTGFTNTIPRDVQVALTVQGDDESAPVTLIRTVRPAAGGLP